MLFPLQGGRNCIFFQWNCFQMSSYSFSHLLGLCLPLLPRVLTGLTGSVAFQPLQPPGQQGIPQDRGRWAKSCGTFSVSVAQRDTVDVLLCLLGFMSLYCETVQNGGPFRCYFYYTICVPASSWCQGSRQVWGALKNIYQKDLFSVIFNFGPLTKFLLPQDNN